MHHPGIWGRGIAPLQHPSYQRPQQSRPLIEILRETPSFRAGRKGGGPCGATAEPSGGVEAPAFRPGRTSTDYYRLTQLAGIVGWNVEFIGRLAIALYPHGIQLRFETLQHILD